MVTTSHSIQYIFEMNAFKILKTVDCIYKNFCSQSKALLHHLCPEVSVCLFLFSAALSVSVCISADIEEGHRNF